MPRRIFRVRGTVQGVGFRPFVYRAALELGLRGRVWNDADGVVVDVEGEPRALQALAERIDKSPPARAKVERVEAEAADPLGFEAFRIVGSAAPPPASPRVSADLATCPACLHELHDRRDRRHLYPFVNCTDCGPRYSIVRDVPYDRARTTMSVFAMCGPCRSEYGGS